MALKNILQAFFASVPRLFGRRNETAANQSKFVDLAPTDKADEAGIYSDALTYATNSPQIANIALTGPYGSGKSSIIKSFLKTYKRPHLKISLAAFLPDASASRSAASRQEIERSILQQMLYGADANRLPLSRFKRIQSPGSGAIFTSLYIALGLFASWHLSQNAGQIVSGKYFLPFSLSNWFNIVCLLLGGSFLWSALHYLYVASFGVSLKSVSLKNIEITPIAASQESILNRHLDEIIYFFQSTKYDLVIVEDLDRFENADIFVTLREINSLVNANSGVKRIVRFLYALRDDMFVNVDRTKFFEFIVPVIPIINSSNSIDKVLEHGKRLSLDERLDRQFLREVSRYLNDLRLIQNIFNEYAIYISNLETGDDKVLDPNKLLAVLIYKNVFPRDFESLHRGKGGLAHILSRRDEFVASAEAEFKARILEMQEQIEAAQHQFPSDLLGLRRIYAMALVEKLPAGTSHLGERGHALVDLSSLAKHDTFDEIIEAQRILYRTVHGHEAAFDISGLQAEVDPARTYGQRVEEMRAVSSEAMSEAAKTIGELREKISALRMSKFNETIRTNAGRLEEQFESFGENRELARYLVFEGYLDDTYYQYTSLFHSGRLSPNDNKFLIQIRGFVTPEPDFQIDNAKEVVAAMRDDDFRQSYVLNVRIVDCLLAERPAYASQAAKLFELITSDFAQCEAFFAAYYSSGAHVLDLLTELAEGWAGFVPAALASSQSLSHVGQIISELPPETLETLARNHPEVSEFVSENLSLILRSKVDIDPRGLKSMAIEIADLDAIEDFPSVAGFLVEEGRYEITIGNIDFIFRTLLGLDDMARLHSRHYTTVLGAQNSALTSRIERNFSTYLEDVLLELEDNTQESVPAILSAIGRDDIAIEDLSAFLERQSALIPALDQVPSRLHTLVFQLSKIEASWANCLAFVLSEQFDAETLTGYLNTDAALTTLASLPIPDGEQALALRTFLIENDALREDNYRAYMRRLPDKIADIPEDIGIEKCQILIEEEKVLFSPENMESIEEDLDLQVLFAAMNIEQYLADQSKFEVDDDFRERLLASSIGDDEKLEIVRSMDMAEVAALPVRAGVVGPILHRTGADMRALDPEVASAVIINSAPISVQIELLNRSQSILSVDNVRNIIGSLPSPFSDIKAGYYTPYLPLTKENIELAEWLDDRNFISSWSETTFTREIRINLYRASR